MITQRKIGLDSRSEANPFDKDGFLPLITAPMYSVVDESNYQLFLDNKIQVCRPRNIRLGLEPEDIKTLSKNNPIWFSYSLDEFRDLYLQDWMTPIGYLERACIDTANGNMPLLHETIRKAKLLHGDNLIIMAGNVGSVNAFEELAKTGVDYIRVGIGGGGGCNTTSNVGVGQFDLGKLIEGCVHWKQYCVSKLKTIDKEGKQEFYTRHGFGENIDLIEQNYNDTIATSKVKIVADGISSYIKQCETKYGFNDNGYAAINKLLYCGADLVMIGKLFTQCVESAGEKGVQQYSGVEPFDKWQKNRENHIGLPDMSTPSKFFNISKKHLVVKYSGMSTQQEQLKYKPVDDERVLLSSSEGSVQWIPVRWTLDEWLNGSNNQDTYPYLMGWINSVKSMMAYTNKTTLQ